MTQDKARKIATRQRMAETGEPYSVARHVVEDERVEDEREAAESVPGDPGAAEAGSGLRERAERARRLAEEAQERAEQAQERAGQADEAAMRAHDAADMAAEAAELTSGWADEREQELAHRRAAEAQAAAEAAQYRFGLAEREAERADEAAMMAQDAADLAAEAADLAGEEADEAEEEAGEHDGPPRHWAYHYRGHHHRGRGPWDGGVPPVPPRTAGTARAAGSPCTTDDQAPAWGTEQPRTGSVGLVWQRFDELRERADWMVSQAERLLNLAREQASRPSQAVRPDPAQVSIRLRSPIRPRPPIRHGTRTPAPPEDAGPGTAAGSRARGGAARPARRLDAGQAGLPG